MSSLIFPMPIEQVDRFLGDTMNGASPEVQRVILSVSHYLKDARRWHYVEQYEIPVGLSPNGTRKWVDQQLKEVNDGVERVIRARQRREDGVPGGEGTGGTPNPIV